MAKEGDKRIGNQFWKLRYQHGRLPIFKTPAQLREGAEAYFTACVENPILIHEIRNNSNDSVYIEKPRVFLKEGLVNFLGICSYEIISDLRINKDFVDIIGWIERTIYMQKFENAAAGVYNASIISRDLSLVDRTASESRVTVTSQDLDLLSEEELISRLKK